MADAKAPAGSTSCGKVTKGDFSEARVAGTPKPQMAFIHAFVDRARKLEEAELDHGMAEIEQGRLGSKRTKVSVCGEAEARETNTVSLRRVAR